ncbi:MAG: aldo/keto reductase [Propionibacteriaceae bacterium]|nr:aldo/keto reductase [Propionibacteriaceae bacterium]
METARLGKTGFDVSVIGQGCWQFGGDWGEVGDADALAVLNAAADGGVTFFDTADVYGDGHSEELVGRFLRERRDDAIVVATKLGRRASPFAAETYTRRNLRAWTERSLRLLGVDVIDLTQLHCPPTPVYSTAAVYDALDELVTDGWIRNYGVSVETVDEALTALEHPGVATIQIICNVFRRKPLEQVLPAAEAAGVGIIARVPLASGLLSGRFTAETTFAATDHRTYNRHGEAFDQGETFSGVPYEVGVEAAREFVTLVPEGVTPAQFALRWILDQDGISTVIPGASRPSQAAANTAAADLPPLTAEQLAALEAIYDRRIRAHVHSRW